MRNKIPRPQRAAGPLVLAMFLFVAAPRLPAQTDATVNPDSPRLLNDPVAAASLPLPDPRPKPVVLPDAVVLDTVEYVLPAEGRSIIVQKIQKPAGYVPPPIPRPTSPPPAAAPSEESLAKARAAAVNRPQMRHLQFSSTVYPIGPVEDARKATLVRWTHDGQSYQAWSSIDWNHFRSIGQFASADGKTMYHCMMGIGNATGLRKHPNSPVPPDFKSGEITYQLTEGETTHSAALADLETLHNLYRTDGYRLKQAYEIREKAIAERKAWLEANPPKPEDIIVRHWDIPSPKAQPSKEEGPQP